MSSKKPYFPNNIEGVMDTTYFPVDVETVMDNSLLWEIPSSVCVIMRAENVRTGKVEEYSYQSVRHARERLHKLMISGDYEVTLADEDSISLLKPGSVE